MASNDTTQEFKAYLEEYIAHHDCYGLDAFDTRSFVPRSALEEFWDKDKVLDVLCRTSEQERIPADITEILTRYLVVFSILVSISKPEFINLFMSTETSLDDGQLPISSTPTEWTDIPENKAVLEEFEKAQWRFCPLTFDRRRYMTKLNAYHILPISNKKLLDSNADEDGDVVVYEALWHPRCLGLLPSRKVVFKVYHMRDQQVITSLLSEVDIYSNLREYAFDHIVRYFGSFEQHGMLTIALEFAREGNLVEFLGTTPPPTRLEDRFALWDSFFQLLLGLDATHNLNAALGNQNKEGRWLLKGIHQDIRPQNILVTATEPNSYRIYFKLTDFGTGHVRRCRSKGVDMMGAQRRGNGMYSAPESYRDNNLTRPQLCECDIWSLGGVASELLVWSIKGDAKRLEYQNRRCKATGKTRLAGGYHEGSFHDGECRLPTVDNEHQALLGSIDKDDFISRHVSSIILDHMLVATVANRSSASKVYEVWQSVVAGMHHRAGPLGSRRGTRDSHMSARSGLGQRQSVHSILSSPQAFDSKSNHEPWLENTHLISEPVAMLSGLRPSASREDSASVRHVQFEEQQGNGNPGPSSTSSVSVSGAGRGIRREINDSSVLGSPFGPAPEIHHQENGFPHSRSFTSSFYTRQNGHHGFSRTGTSSSNNRPISSSPPCMTSRRQTADEYHDIPEIGDASTGGGAGLGIDTRAANRPPETPSVERSNTHSSRFSAQTSPPHISTTSVGRSNTHSSRRSVHASPQQGFATIPESAERVTINQIYETIISAEGTSRFGRMTSLNRPELLTDFPRLKVALKKLRGRKGREQIFIVDDSVSMLNHRDQMGKTVRVLARLLKEGGVDPDKKMSLYFLCASDTIAFKNTKDEFHFKHSKGLQEAVIKRKFSKEPCDIRTELDQIVSNNILTGTSTNPVSIYVLTNGRWNANPGDAQDLCRVEGIIEKILGNNKTNSRQRNHFGFQFIRFYDSKDPEDIVGKMRLDYLDNSLADQFQKLEIEKSDIIDTTDWDDDVRKMLLGGVIEDED